MPAEAGESGPGPPGAVVWYSYAVLRVVPRVERGEYVSVGVILFARTLGFLEARLALDEERLRAFAPEADLAPIKRHLDTIKAICAGSPNGGPLAAQPPSERFHWLTAPRSTVVQTSPIHIGWWEDPSAALEDLLDAFVRPPRQP
jgi:hypothetical protein